MKKIIKLSFLFFTVLSFSQSPWTQEKGKFYTQLSFTTISNYNDIFGNPDYKTERFITDNTLQFYSEIGLSDKTSLLVNIPLKMVKSDNLTPVFVPNNNTTAASQTSLGNIELGVKHNFYNDGWVLSGQLSIEANTSSFSNASGLRTGYDAWSITPLFLAGKGFEKSYFQTFIGANIRTNDYSSNFKIGGEYGRKLGNHIWLIGFVDVVKSFKNGSVALPNNNLLTALYVNDQEYGAFGLKAIGEITNNFGINAGFGGAFFGNNVAKQVALTFGVYQKF